MRYVGKQGPFLFHGEGMNDNPNYVLMGAMSSIETMIKLRI